MMNRYQNHRHKQNHELTLGSNEGKYGFKVNYGIIFVKVISNPTHVILNVLRRKMTAALIKFLSSFSGEDSLF